MALKLSSASSQHDDGWTYTDYFADIDTLDKNSFKHLSEFMRTKFVPQVYQDFVGIPTDGLFVTFSLRIGDEIVLSEKTLWDMMIDALDNWEEEIVLYTETIEQYFSRKIDLPWTSTTEQLGAYALQNCFDRALRDETFNLIDLNLIDAYFTHVKLCDLDHEVHQHDYMLAIIDMLMTRDPIRMVEWVKLRYFNGQHGGMDPEAPVKAYRVSGAMKELIDGMVRESYPADVFRSLCNIVYGSNADCIAEVMGYVELEFRRLDLVLREPQQQYPLSTHDTDAADVFLSSVSKHYPPFEIDTGFHTFDRNSKSWVR